MLKRKERYMRLLSPAEGGGTGQSLGYYPVSVNYRTSEEVEAGDVLYTNLRCNIYADRNRAPVGGYKRGMILESIDSSERYHILVPILAGRFWIMKTERVLMNGEGDTDGRENYGS